MIVLKFRIWFYYFRRSIKRSFLFWRIMQFGKSDFAKINFYNEIDYLSKNGLVIFPYFFEKKYKSNEVQVDIIYDYPVVDFYGKKMFFQKSHTVDHVKYYFNSILLEQDINSPHRYCSDFFMVEENDIIVDLGVAEGNFSFFYIEKVKKAFLFESNIKWVEALEKTFLPFSNKVVIINKEVSYSSSEFKVSLDDISELKNQPLFIKIDVDGAEWSVLKGMSNLLNNNKELKIAICTYHKQNDSVEFEEFFKNLGFQTEFTPGYMLFYHDKKLKAPYFRKGVLRAWKAK